MESAGAEVYAWDARPEAFEPLRPPEERIKIIEKTCGIERRARFPSYLDGGRSAAAGWRDFAFTIFFDCLMIRKSCARPKDSVSRREENLFKLACSSKNASLQ
jgi:hypothetical protein